MSTAMLDAIDSHIHRGHAIFGELVSAPFLPSSVKGATDFGNVAPPALCSATIASLASTVTALVRRVARLETTCIVLEGKWVGASQGRGAPDALAFSDAMTNAMRPLNDILSRHEAAIERIAAHIAAHDSASPRNWPQVSTTHPKEDPSVGIPRPTTTTQNMSPPADDDEQRRLEGVAHRLRSLPSATAGTASPTPHTTATPQAASPDATDKRESSPSTAGYTTTTPTATTGSSNPVTTTTATSDALRPLSLRGSSISTNEALRALWGSQQRNAMAQQQYSRGPSHQPHRFIDAGIDASAMTVSGGASHDVSAEETILALAALNDVSGPSLLRSRRANLDGLSSTAESGAMYRAQDPFYRGHFASSAVAGNGGIFDRVRGILSGDEGSDTSYRYTAPFCMQDWEFGPRKVH